jgi:hypothetical protein
LDYQRRRRRLQRRTDSYLADDPAPDSPSGSSLSGFRYQRFAPLDGALERYTWDVQARITWLRKLSPEDPQPWHHAASVYSTHGGTVNAGRVLIAQRRVASSGGRNGKRCLSGIKSVTDRIRALSGMVSRLGRRVGHLFASVVDWACGLLGFG